MFCEMMFKAPIVNPKASTGTLLGITDLMLLIEAGAQPDLRLRDAMFLRAPNTFGQCKSDIRSWDGHLQRGVTRNIVRTCSGLRRGAEYDIFTSADFIHRRHSLNGGIHLSLPEHSAGLRIQGREPCGRACP
jgi:hypothetical protein